MKNLIIIIVGILSITTLKAQDILTTHSGQQYEVKITKETNEDITYYQLSDESKILRTTKKDLFKSINKFEIPKNTNLIQVVSTELSEEALYKSIGKYLKGEGYTFETTDKDFLMIKTNAKVIDNDINYWFDISVNKNVIHVRAYSYSSVFNAVQGNTNKTNGNRCANAGMKNSPMKLPFTMLNELLEEYTSTTEASLQYKKE